MSELAAMLAKGIELSGCGAGTGAGGRGGSDAATSADVGTGLDLRVILAPRIPSLFKSCCEIFCLATYTIPQFAHHAGTLVMLAQ